MRSALGFVVTAMFVLGLVFLALYAGSWYLGAQIDRERAERRRGYQAESREPADPAACPLD